MLSVAAGEVVPTPALPLARHTLVPSVDQVPVVAPATAEPFQNRLPPELYRRLAVLAGVVDDRYIGPFTDRVSAGLEVPIPRRPFALSKTKLAAAARLEEELAYRTPFAGKPESAAEL